MASGAIARGGAVACIPGKKFQKGCGTRRSTASDSHARTYRRIGGLIRILGLKK